MHATWPPGPDHHRWVLLWLGGLVVAFGSILGWSSTAAVFAIAVQVVFGLLLLRHLSFAIAASRTVHDDASRHIVDAAYRPPVTVLVAMKDEIAVVEQLVAALRDLTYPQERLQIILVDDASTDGTARRLDAITPLGMEVIHRAAGAGGGKSGALNSALPHIRGEIVVVFDADHRPDPDIVERHVRHYIDSRVGAVQGRCRIGNADEGIVAGTIALEYEAGYLVNEYGRQAVFGLPAYGGANCSVRLTSLLRHGGWNPNSHTEDTDLTMRLVLAGEVVRYDVTAIDTEEAVTTLGRYWRQRYRWARGHQQVLRDYWRLVRGARHLTAIQQFETYVFLSIYHVPVIALSATLLGIATLFGAVLPGGIPGAYVFWPLLFLGPLAELGAAMLLARVPRRRALGLLWFFPLYALSMVIATKAWVDGSLGRGYSWAKTARSGSSLVTS